MFPVPMPGLIPGHQSLLVRLDSGDAVMCPDCVCQRPLDGVALLATDRLRRRGDGGDTRC